MEPSKIMESTAHLSVRPVSPAAGYQGGKKNLARRICAIIDRTPHDGYAEPFVGMGGIFLRRSTKPKAEVINDLSGDVANFFRVLQEHYPYFIDMLRWRLASRNEFERLRDLPAGRLTDLQRAARFLYLQRLTFGGKVRGRNFGVDSRSGARFNVSRLEPMLADIHERLAGVVIEQLPFDHFIPRYDRPGMLFYLDPPYFGCEGDYGAGTFSRGDFTTAEWNTSGIFLSRLDRLSPPLSRRLPGDLRSPLWRHRRRPRSPTLAAHGLRSRIFRRR